MKVKHILFDLDGTLLPLNQKEFTNKCFELLSNKLAPYGYSLQDIAIATNAMIKNNGEQTNEKAFWNELVKLKNININNDKKYFDDFYNVNFDNIKMICGFNPIFKDIIKNLKNIGCDFVCSPHHYPAFFNEKSLWKNHKP